MFVKSALVTVTKADPVVAFAAVVTFYTISKTEYKQPGLTTTKGLPHDLNKCI